MKNSLYLYVIIPLFCSTLLSQNPEITESNTESFYIYIGFGYSKTFYPSELDEIVEFLNEQDDVSHTPLAIDLFGIYFHATPKTIVGGILGGVADRYDRGERGAIQINQYLFGGSVMHYLGPSFGSGVFIRSDIGVASVIADEISLRENGLGILLGGGWSFDLGGTRILLNANYTYRGFQSGSYHTISFSIGGLF